ncbi:MAG: 23S rRNA (guanosine(2251)-2'-O)-methyltransferase RlmB [Anaerolineales bacterium]
MSTEVLYGRNPVLEALRAGRRSYHQLMLAENLEKDERLDQITALAEEFAIPVERVSRHRFDAIPGNAQGVMLRVSAYPYVDLEDMLARANVRGEPPWFLLLDVLQDPQNVATLLRTAEAVGVHGVILPLRRSASITPSVVSASSGASEHLLIGQANLAQSIDWLKEQEIWITGLEGGLAARPIGKADLKGPMGLVVGSEGEGMRRLVRESCDFLVRLPMRGKIESLNAAAAGAVALYFILAARGYPAPAKPVQD